jgi:hypothetical protein
MKFFLLPIGLIFFAGHLCGQVNLSTLEDVPLTHTLDDNNIDSWVTVSNPVDQNNPTSSAGSLSLTGGSSPFSFIFTPQQDFQGIVIFDLNSSDANTSVLTTHNFIIEVNASNDAPKLKLYNSSQGLTEDANVSFSIGENVRTVAYVGYSDADVGDVVSIDLNTNLADHDNARFTIESYSDIAGATHRVMFNSTTDHEAASLRADGDRQYYLIAVRAIDQNGSTSENVIDLTVIDDEEAPTIENGSLVTFDFNITEDKSGSDQGSFFANYGKNYALSAVDPDASDSTTSLLWSLDTNQTLIGKVYVHASENDSDISSATLLAEGSVLDTNATGGKLYISYVPDGNVTGSESFRVKVRDPDDANFYDTIEFQINIDPVNDDPPIFTGTANPVFSKNESATGAIATIGAVDADLNAVLVYELVTGSNYDKAFFDINSSTGAISLPSSLNYESFSDANSDNNFSLLVRVTDSVMGDSIEQIVTITLFDVAESPILNSINTSLAVNEDSNLTITSADFRDSYVSVADVDIDDNNSLVWSIYSVSTIGSTILLDGGTSYTGQYPTFTYSPPSNFPNPNVHNDANDSFELKVTDPNNLSVTIPFTVVISATSDSPLYTSIDYNGNPIDLSGYSSSQRVSVLYPENTTNPLPIVITAEDYDGSTLSFEKYGSSDINYFDLNQTTVGGGVFSVSITFAGGFVPNFEDAQDSGNDNNYSLQLNVSDGTRSDLLYLDIIIEDQSEEPSISKLSPSDTDSNSTIYLPENTQEVATLQFTDPDAEDPNVSWKISGGIDRAKFDLNATSGVLSFKSDVIPDFEGNGSASANNTYEVQVKLYENNTSLSSDPRTFYIIIEDANDPPVITTPELTVNEPDRFIANLGDYLSDQDTSDSHSWSYSSNSDLNNSSFLLETNGTLKLRFDSDADGSTNPLYYYVKVKADDGKTGGEVEATFTIFVQEVNETPYFINNLGQKVTSIELVLNEDQTDYSYSLIDTNNIHAIDPDPNGAVGFDWDIVNDPAFGSADVSNGVITYIPNPDWNYEQNKTSVSQAFRKDEFSISVTDSGGKTEIISVFAKVIPVNDSPYFTNDPLSTSVSIDENTDFVMDFNVSDSNDGVTATNSNSIIWTVSGNHSSKFLINQGSLSFITAPDYDSPKGDNNTNIYTITVSAEDTDQGSVSHTLQVLVRNINEKPIFINDNNESVIGPFYVTISEDEEILKWATEWNPISALDYDSILAGDQLVWKLENNSTLYSTARGEAVIDPNSGALTYTPNPNVKGIDTFKVRTIDTLGIEESFDVYVTVKSVNDSPHIIDIDVTTPDPILVYEGSRLVRSFTAFDYDDNLTNSLNDTSTPLSQISWRLTGADDDFFQIESNGSVYFRQPPVFDVASTNLYQLTVSATDDDTIYTDFPIRIQVRNINDAPVFTNYLDEIHNDPFNEFPAKKFVKINLSENSTVVYDANATDSEGDNIIYNVRLLNDLNVTSSGFSVQQELSPFIFDSVTGVIRLAAPIDYESPLNLGGAGGTLSTIPQNGVFGNQGYQVGFHLEVNATDNGSPTQSTLQNILVMITNEDELPEFNSSQSYTLSINENNALAIPNLFDYVYDPEGPGTIAFEAIGGDDAGLFSLNDATGELSFQVSPDFEKPADTNNDNSYEVEISLSNSLQSTISQVFKIQVLNVNDAPVLSDSSTLKLTIPENQSFVKKFEFIDQDNNNSKLDIFYVVDGSDVKFVTNQSGATPSFSSSYTVATSADGISPYSLKSADFNRDGFDDVVVLSKGNVSGIDLFLNNGSGNFSGSKTVFTGDVDHIDLADIDEDGFTDIIAISTSLDAIYAWGWTGSGFADIVNGGTTSNISSTGSVDEPIAMNLDDLDQDGDIDVLVIGKGSSEISWFENLGANQSYAFSPKKYVLQNHDKVYNPIDSSTGDIDQDGDQDVLFVSGDSFYYCLNDGFGRFADPVVLYQETGATAFRILCDHLDNDDKLDVVVCFSKPTKFGVLLQNGTASLSFATPEIFDTGSVVSSIEFGDVQGDGSLDLVTVSASDVSVDLFINNGVGLFSSSTEVARTSTSSISSASWANIDEDFEDFRFEVLGGNDASIFEFRPKYSPNLWFRNSPNHESPSDYIGINQYEIKVGVTSISVDGNATATSSVLLSVIDVNDPPEITNLVSQHQVYENALNIFTFEFADEDDNPKQEFTYKIVDSHDGDFFNLNESGDLTFKAPPDAETPLDSDSDNNYTMVIRVEDDGAGFVSGSAYLDYYINVFVMDGSPEFYVSPGGDMFSVSEEGSLIVDFNSTDLNSTFEAGQGPLSWSLSSDPFYGNVVIDDASLTLQYYPDSNFSGDDNFTLRATDKLNRVGDVLIKVKVNPVNDAPSFTSTVIEHPEGSLIVGQIPIFDSDDQSIEYKLAGGLDETYFKLSSSGILNFRIIPDYELPLASGNGNDYEITVEISDGEYSVQENLTVRVTNLNDNIPIIGNQNLHGKQSIFLPEDSEVVVDLNFTDPDGGVIKMEVVSGEDANLFKIENNSVKFAPLIPDFEAPHDADKDNVYHFNLQISDTNFTATDAINTEELSVSVYIENVNEFPPVWTSPPFTPTSPITVNENEPFVIDLNATDDLNVTLFTILDADDNLTSDAHLFDLNHTSGILTFKFENVPDFEMPNDLGKNNLYELSVALSDGEYNATIRNIYVYVEDVNEAPVLATTTFEMLEDGLLDIHFDDFNGTDAENDSFTFVLIKDSQAGVLEEISAKHYTYKPNQDFFGTDFFNLQVYEVNASYDYIVQPIQILVTPVNDPPTAVPDDIDYLLEDGQPMSVNFLLNDSSFPDDPSQETLTLKSWTLDSTLNEDRVANFDWNSSLPPSTSETFSSTSTAFLFTPPVGFIGPVSFSYEVTDGNLSSSAKVRINVTRSPQLTGWRYYDNFGYLNESEDNWIFIEKMGWVYVHVPSDLLYRSTWCWSEYLGWFWTGNDYFSYVFIKEFSKWMLWQGSVSDTAGWSIVTDYNLQETVSPEIFQIQRAASTISSLDSAVKVSNFIKSSTIFTEEEKNIILRELIFTKSSKTLESYGIQLGF